MHSTTILRLIAVSRAAQATWTPADDYLQGWKAGHEAALSNIEKSVLLEEALPVMDRAAIASEAGERAEAQYAELDRLDGRV